MSYDHLRHARIHRFDEALERYGEDFVALVASLQRADPLADRAVEALWHLSHRRQMGLIDDAVMGQTDEAPAELVELVEDAAQEPDWVDWCRLERGQVSLMRTGALGGIVLGVKSLVEGYCSPAGNKPLILSGQLYKKPAMRLNETARFLEKVATRGQMRPGGEGFAITLKVRLMHARVRALIWRSGRWRNDLWALPINQHDMVATVHLFATVFLEGMETLGVEFSELEKEDFHHLWRYVGHVIGVEDTLLPRARVEAERQWEMLLFTQGPPDEDARELTRALLEGQLRAARTEAERRAGEKHAVFARGICRALLGDELGEALGVPVTHWTHLTHLLGHTLRTLAPLRRAPLVDDFLHEQGRRYWADFVAPGAERQPIRFDLPLSLGGRL